MSGAMRKMGVYLGLFEDTDADLADVDGYEVEDTESHQLRDERVANIADRRRTPAAPVAPAATVATPLSRITTLHPRTYNEARVIGENFRDGVPVIMNLSEMGDADAKRLVDFAAGLVFAVRGSIERVTNKVFLLSPPNVSVTAEDKQRIAEGGFFNQS
ncbi:MAG TPA: cell division protein SepF [Marmoricola sp.]|nr:cell division protein SepF [Marmoricola sp.]